MLQESKKVAIINKYGLHVRPSTVFVQTANLFQCEIKVKANDHIANGKSIIGLLTLEAQHGDTLEITAKGDDAREALKALEDLVLSRFGFDE